MNSINGISAQKHSIKENKVECIALMIEQKISEAKLISGGVQVRLTRQRQVENL